MRILALFAVVVALSAFALLVACGQTTTVEGEPTYRCTSPREGGCSTTCEPVATDAGCTGVPGLFGHPSKPTDAGRALGCEISLPYENPYYPGSPQTCTCDSHLDAAPAWVCPI